MADLKLILNFSSIFWKGHFLKLKFQELGTQLKAHSAKKAMPIQVNSDSHSWHLLHSSEHWLQTKHEHQGADLRSELADKAQEWKPVCVCGCHEIFPLPAVEAHISSIQVYKLISVLSSTSFPLHLKLSRGSHCEIDDNTRNNDSHFFLS